jgi:hypothetical protein
VAAEDFTERMRDRMPSHRVWREPESTPAVSRPANDALWNDMRSRLRSYHDVRRQSEAHANRVVAAVERLRRPSNIRSTGAIIIAGGLIVASLYELLH